MLQIIPVIASDMGLGEAGLTAIFGYLLVFCGLALLMTILYIMGACFQANAKKKAVAEKTAVVEEKADSVLSLQEESPATLAPGSAGHVKLYDVPDKEAAMVMAVVAYQMQKPLHELRFISIKEVQKDEV